MKTLSAVIFFLIPSYCLLAQGKIPKAPNDYYVTKQGDTVYGSVSYGMKNDGFKLLTGEKIKLKPNSIASYAFYLENANRGRNDPYYSARTFINVGNKFYEIEYNGNGPVRVITDVKNGVPGIYSMRSFSEDDTYYFEKKGVLTKFHANSFYGDAHEYMIDCPVVIAFLDHVPNDNNSTKTHKAKMRDLDVVMSKYNECISGKK